MQTDANNARQLLLSDTGDHDRGRSKTYVTVLDNIRPAGSYTVRVSTQYSQARDPQAHQVKLSLHVGSKDELKKLVAFLADCAD